MEADYQDILRDIGAASDFAEAIGIIVDRVIDVVGLDACAVYLIDVDSEQHVLMASAGMGLGRGEAVRSDRRVGLLGLVDDRQELVALTHASSHPRYFHSAETATNHFESFVGIPLIHLGRIRGILAGWRKLSQEFAPRELTVVVTVAAQLSGILHEVAAADEIEHLLKGGTHERDFVEGVQAAPGLAIGIATVLQPAAMSRHASGVPTLDVEVEERAFRAAIANVCLELEVGERQLAEAVPEEVRELFGVCRQLVTDEVFLEDAIERIRAGMRAADAWREAVRRFAGRFEQIEDAYLQAKADDVLEIGDRVLTHLESRHDEAPVYPEQCILVADRVGITDIAAVPGGRLAGIVCRYGSVLSHGAVLARALHIPAVVRLASLPTGLIGGCTMGVDGDRGRVYVNPSPSSVDRLQRTIEGRRARPADLEALFKLPARTRDGVTVRLQANIGLPSDTDVAIAGGAEGIGLYRTEYQFLTRDGFPAEEEQYVSYLAVLAAFAPGPVTIRTLDVGGDKILSYFPVTEDNPFLGSRGVRFSLSHPEIFQIQLRALLRANAVHRNLRVLFPMIARVSEADAARRLLERSHGELLEEGQASAMPRVGVMIEVPSAVFLSATLAERFDFLSIGSNDLAQYILAADRTNSEVADPDDTLHPAVLHAMRQVIRHAHRRGKPVSACGEMAGDAVGAVLLLGMGADELSMSSPALMPVKRAIRSVTAARARTLLRRSLALEDGSEVRELLTRALRGEPV